MRTDRIIWIEGYGLVDWDQTGLDQFNGGDTIEED